MMTIKPLPIPPPILIPHTHDEVNSPPVDAGHIYFPITTSAPTDKPRNGIIRLALISGTYYLYARINNTWKRTTLT